MTGGLLGVVAQAPSAQNSLSGDAYPGPSLHDTVTAMSRASKITLAATSLGAIGIVIFVHTAQRSEKAVSHPHLTPVSCCALLTAVARQCTPASYGTTNSSG